MKAVTSKQKRELRDRYHSHVTDTKLPEGKFIRMPKKKLERWLEVLRAGANQDKQGKGKLFNDIGSADRVGYCCLGVCQWALSDGVEKDGGFPSEWWLEQEGIIFHNKQHGMATNPWLLVESAADLNDARNYPFRIIADLIELATETY